ncbi:MAG: O-antigen ligase family protein, partial [bacterium]
IFITSIFLSGINNWNDEILSNKFLFSALFFFIFLNEIKSKRQLKQILYLLFASSIVASIYGLYQYFFLGFNRVKGFSFSLTFGNMVAVMIIFLSVYIVWGNFNYKIKSSLVLINISFIANLIFTQSRGAWLGFIGGAFFLSLVKSKKVVIFLLLIIIFSFILLPTQYINRFKSSFDISYDLKNNRSNTLRIEMWKTAIEIMKDYPVFGLGYDNYRTPIADSYKTDAINRDRFIHVHNSFLQFGAELGLLGLFSFLYLMLLILKKIFIFYKKNDNNIKLFHLSSIITILIYFIQGMTQYNFGKTEPLSFFWIIIALNFLINKYQLLVND